MKINIKATGVELGGNVEEYVRKKLGNIERFGNLLGNDATLHLILAKTSGHHRTGDDAFSAEIQLRALGRDVTATSFGRDIYAAIDGLKDELSKMLVGTAGKERTLTRRGAALIKKFLKRKS